MNQYWQIPPWNEQHNEMHRITIVTVPHRKVFFGCNKGECTIGPIPETAPWEQKPPYWGNMRPAMAVRHSGRPNILFLDLHAEHISLALMNAWYEYFIYSPGAWIPPIDWEPQWGN